MKQLLIGMMVLLPLGLYAAVEVDETKAVNKDGYVVIKVVRGKVDVVGWDKAEVRVRGKLDEQLEEFVFEVNDDYTLIEVRINEEDSGWYNRNKGSELTIHVPQHGEVDFGGVSTDFTATGVEGELDVSVVSGDIQVGPGEGDVDLNSVSGDVEVTGRKNRVEAQSVSGDVVGKDNSGPGEYVSVSGDVEVTNAGRELQMQTISGDILVRTGMLEDADGQSVSGDIQVRSGLGDRGKIELESVSGSIELALEGKVDARFSLETGSGAIRNSLTSDRAEESKFMSNESLRFSVGKGSSHVEIATHSGDITVEGK